MPQPVFECLSELCSAGVWVSAAHCLDWSGEVGDFLLSFAGFVLVFVESEHSFFAAVYPELASRDCVITYVIFIAHLAGIKCFNVRTRMM